MTPPRGLHSIAILFLSVLLVPHSRAQRPVLDGGSALMFRSPDMHFVMGLSQAAAGEADLGRLAAEKANAAAVKQYGQLMAEEYTRMQATLKELVVSKHATLPDEIPARQLGLKTKLQRQSGARFDRTYMKAMVKDQKGRIKSFRQEIKKGQDRSVQQFASETLPVLEGHLEKARSLFLAVKAKPAQESGTEKKP